jgi:hypothetical protein
VATGASDLFYNFNFAKNHKNAITQQPRKPKKK